MLELLFSEYRAVFQDVLVVVICGAALIWGGGPERAVAAVWLVVFEAAYVVDYFLTGGGSQVLQVDLYLAVGDILAGVLWIGIALYANRNYPLWIAGMQVLAMSAHMARGLSDLVAPIAYVVLVVAPGWFQLLFLAIGLIRHVRRKRKFGKYRDWRTVPGASEGAGATFGPNWLSDSKTTWRDDLK